MNKLVVAVVSALFLFADTTAQTRLEGYVYEENNRGFLNQVNVTVYKDLSDSPVDILITDIYGHFAIDLAPGKYRVVATRELFSDWTETVIIKAGEEKKFLKTIMKRKPGVMLEAHLLEKSQPALRGATIEIYNRTLKSLVLTLTDFPEETFRYPMERGYHYTIRVKTPGFLTQRMEVYAGIMGCELCVEGLGEGTSRLSRSSNPATAPDTLYASLYPVRAQKGTLLQTITSSFSSPEWFREPAVQDQIDLYVTLLKDNPGLVTEMGAFTDSRADEEAANAIASERTDSLSAFLLSRNMEPFRCQAKAYGRTSPLNKCAPGVKCTDAEHAENNRIEIRLISFSNARFLNSLDQSINIEEREKVIFGRPMKRPAKSSKIE
ncbi:MAG: hypothetical protein ACKOCO_16995 [Bacteroidota bacterium]